MHASPLHHPRVCCRVCHTLFLALQANPDTFDGLINWKKRELMGNSLEYVATCQAQLHTFGARQERIVNFLHDLPEENEVALFLASFLLCHLCLLVVHLVFSASRVLSALTQHTIRQDALYALSLQREPRNAERKDLV
jgi:hypothetical protein